MRESNVVSRRRRYSRAPSRDSTSYGGSCRLGYCLAAISKQYSNMICKTISHLTVFPAVLSAEVTPKQEHALE